MWAGERNRKNRREIRKVPTPRQGFAGRVIDFQKWAATPRGRSDVRTSRAARPASESTPGWTSTSQTGVTTLVERHASDDQPRPPLPNRGERHLNRSDSRFFSTQVELDPEAGPASRSCLHENSSRKWSWTVKMDPTSGAASKTTLRARSPIPFTRIGRGTEPQKLSRDLSAVNLHASGAGPTDSGSRRGTWNPPESELQRSRK